MRRSAEHAKWGLVVGFVALPVVIVMSALRAIAWVFDMLFDELDKHRAAIVKEWMEFRIVLLVVLAFMVLHFGGLWLVLEHPFIKETLANYKKECGGPDYPPCQ